MKRSLPLIRMVVAGIAVLLMLTGCKGLGGLFGSREVQPVLSDIEWIADELVVYPGDSTLIQLNGSYSDGTSGQVAAEDVELQISSPDVFTLEGLSIFANRDAEIGTQARLTIKTEELELEIPVTVKYSLEDTLTGQRNSDGVPVVANYHSTAVLVNKQRSLPDDYRPDDLVIADIRYHAVSEERKYLRKPAADALKALFDAAEQEGVILYAVSGYRSYDTQTMLFNNYVQQHGREQALRFSAPPGTSEHQTGLAMDISIESLAFALDQSFANTAEGRWVAEHAAEFGFIIRYPREYEDVTGYMYEPWHLRYVGEDIAGQIAERSITLEHYFEAVPVSASRS